MVEFRIDAVGTGDGIVVSANLGSDVVTETLTVARDRSTPIHVPSRQFVRYGTEIRFSVSAADPAATLSADLLPDGAYFDPATGEFRWTPDGTQIGAHDIRFTAIDSIGGTATASVAIQVESGKPVVTGVVNAASRSREAACSPGAIASIEGRWLTSGVAVSDPSGASIELGGTKLWANGVAVPILSASTTDVDFLCPNSVPGNELEFVVQTEQGMAEALNTTARAAAPGIFTQDGSGTGQGLVLVEGNNSLAMVRNYRIQAQPAAAGERLVIYATGVDRLANIVVQMGELKTPAMAIQPVPDRPGLYQVVVEVPDLVKQTDLVRLSLSGETSQGTISNTNVVSIAVEAMF
jgi:uncharacterized protein (TIGR03437 family)